MADNSSIKINEIAYYAYAVSNMNTLVIISDNSTPSRVTKYNASIESFITTAGNLNASIYVNTNSPLYNLIKHRHDEYLELSTTLNAIKTAAGDDSISADASRKLYEILSARRERWSIKLEDIKNNYAGEVVGDIDDPGYNPKKAKLYNKYEERINNIDSSYYSENMDDNLKNLKNFRKELVNIINDRMPKIKNSIIATPAIINPRLHVTSRSIPYYSRKHRISKRNISKYIAKYDYKIYRKRYVINPITYTKLGIKPYISKKKYMFLYDASCKPEVKKYVVFDDIISSNNSIPADISIYNATICSNFVTDMFNSLHKAPDSSHFPAFRRRITKYPNRSHPERYVNSFKYQMFIVDLLTGRLYICATDGIKEVIDPNWKNVKADVRIRNDNYISLFSEDDELFRDSNCKLTMKVGNTTVYNSSIPTSESFIIDLPLNSWKNPIYVLEEASYNSASDIYKSNITLKLTNADSATNTLSFSELDYVTEKSLTSSADANTVFNQYYCMDLVKDIYVDLYELLLSKLEFSNDFSINGTFLPGFKLTAKIVVNCPTAGLINDWAYLNTIVCLYSQSSSSISVKAIEKNTEYKLKLASGEELGLTILSDNKVLCYLIAGVINDYFSDASLSISQSTNKTAITYQKIGNFTKLDYLNNQKVSLTTMNSISGYANIAKYYVMCSNNAVSGAVLFSTDGVSYCETYSGGDPWPIKLTVAKCKKIYFRNTSTTIDIKITLKNDNTSTYLILDKASSASSPVVKEIILTSFYDTYVTFANDKPALQYYIEKKS